MKALRWTMLALLVSGLAWPLGYFFYLWISGMDTDAPLADGQMLMLALPTGTALVGLFLLMIAARGVQRGSKKLLVIAVLGAVLVIGIDLAIWRSHCDRRGRIAQSRQSQREIDREIRETDRKISAIFHDVIPHARFSGTLDQTERIARPLIVLERDNQAGRAPGRAFDDSSGWTCAHHMSDAEMDETWQACSVVLIQETGRKTVGQYYRTQEDFIHIYADGKGTSVGPSTYGDPIADAVAVELTVCIVSWPDKRLLCVKPFLGYPPQEQSFYVTGSRIAADGTEDARKKIGQWLTEVASN